MSWSNGQPLSGVAETLLIPLYIRAIESQRPDALLKDEIAVALVRQVDHDSSRILAKIAEETRVVAVLRNREIDRHAQDFLKRNPDAVVVHIGCGLDARFERVDNGSVELYDLDLPEVIELRRKLIGGEGGRHHFLVGSALDSAWLKVLDIHRQRPFLFLAEGVLIYFEEAQVKLLVLTLRERFPVAELLFDAFSPFFVWANNLRVARTGVGARCQWALKRGKDLESWGEDIRLLDESFPFTYPEPRLGRTKWVRFIPLLVKTMGIFHYRLGRQPDDKEEKMSASNPTPSSPQPLPRRVSMPSLLVRLIAVLVILLGLLLLTAGRWDWPQAWAFSLAFCAFLLSYGIWTLRHDPAQLAERSGMKQNVKGWDKTIMSVYTVLLLVLLIVAGLDAGRFRWAPAPPALQVVGWIGLALAGALVFWTTSVNTFLSRYVRIQDERGQQTVTRGPYRWLRHPMYLGVIIMMLGLPLMLGSYWALVPGVLIGVLFAVRTTLEDRTLQAELPGYREYAQKVRYRLFPGIW